MNATTTLYAFLSAQNPAEAEQAARAFLQSFLRGVATPPFPNLIERAARAALQLGGTPDRAWHLFPTLAHHLFPLLPPEVRRVWGYLCPVGETDLVSSLPAGSLVRVPTANTMVVGWLVAVRADAVTLQVGRARSTVTVHPFYPVYLLSLPETRHTPVGGETRRRFIVPAKP